MENKEASTSGGQIPGNHKIKRKETRNEYGAETVDLEIQDLYHVLL